MPFSLYSPVVTLQTALDKSPIEKKNSLDAKLSQHVNQQFLSEKNESLPFFGWIVVSLG